MLRLLPPPDEHPTDDEIEAALAEVSDEAFVAALIAVFDAGHPEGTTP